MPTKREREYYAMGYRDGVKAAEGTMGSYPSAPPLYEQLERLGTRKRGGNRRRKLSKWQQFVKKNSKFPRFKYKSGKKKGMINLKALGVAYRKKKR